MRDEQHRVVVTGIGVVAPNAVGIEAFDEALRNNISGISVQQVMVDDGLICHLAGVPKLDENVVEAILPAEVRRTMNLLMTYSSLAAIEAWRSGGLSYSLHETGPVEWDTGAVLGTGIGSIDTFHEIIGCTNAGNSRRMGGRIAEQAMCSCITACVSGLLGLGGPVWTNSSACTTGTAAVIQSMHPLRLDLGGFLAFSRGSGML